MHDVVYHILRYLKFAPRKDLLFSKQDYLWIEANDKSLQMRIGLDLQVIKDLPLDIAHLWEKIWLVREAKNSVVTLSSVEPKYNAMALGLCELLRLQKVMEELKLGKGKLWQQNCHQYSPKLGTTWSNKIYRDWSTLHQRKVDYWCLELNSCSF